MKIKVLPSIIIYLLFILSVISCTQENNPKSKSSTFITKDSIGMNIIKKKTIQKKVNYSKKYLNQNLPDTIPIPFKIDLIPNDKLIHSGIFSPDLNQFYFTISDKKFQNFDVNMIYKKKDNNWSTPKNAFFNTKYNEHGTSFSPDGKFIYFSSTRPTKREGVSNTWHIWRSEYVNGKWENPMYIDIPNLRDKLVSHPSLTNDGTMYFHSGNLNYSDLSIYYSKQVDGQFQPAVKLSDNINIKNRQKNTPFISPDGSYILFESSSNLYISNKNDIGSWDKATPLPKIINTHGRGNPYISPDSKYLFFVAGVEPNPNENWSVFWVDTKIIDKLNPAHNNQKIK